LLSDEGFANASPASIPMDPSWRTTDDDVIDTVDKLDFARKMGKVGWLSIKMRLDIAAAVSKLQRRNKSPRKEDLNAFKDLLRYLSGTTDLSIPFRRDLTKGLKGFVNSLYTNTKRRKSTKAYI
jgi:hypothetical protein